MNNSCYCNNSMLAPFAYVPYEPYLNGWWSSIGLNFELNSIPYITIGFRPSSSMTYGSECYYVLSLYGCNFLFCCASIKFCILFYLLKVEPIESMNCGSKLYCLT